MITKIGKQIYDPPYPLSKIPGHLHCDPIHRWRAETGIELIHEEPTYGEFERILKNWRLMSPEQKKESDRKSKEMFGVGNLEHARLLRGRMSLKKLGSQLPSIVNLQPHQRRVIERLRNSTDGLIAYHSMGSGKTLTSLAAAEDSLSKDPDSRALFVVPASLVDNVYKEIDKHKLSVPKDRLDVLSYEKAVRSVDDLLANRYSLAVMDEAHKLRNKGTKRYSALSELVRGADKRLFLTGTASYNKASDIAPLINLAAKDKVIPDDPSEFDKKFIKTRKIQPSWYARTFHNAKPSEVEEVIEHPELIDSFGKYVDFHDASESSRQHFPTENEKVFQAQMDKDQVRHYGYLTQNIPVHIRYKIRKGLPLSKQESKDLNAFASGVRQVSDSINPYLTSQEKVFSPKIDLAVRNLEDSLKANPDFRGVVYSNFLDAGLTPYARKLEQKGIAHRMFTGSLSAKDKKQIVEEFNQGGASAPKVLLLSSSGGEGLDLKGVRKVQILEPHFNKAKLDQVRARAARYQSHSHLPEDQRNVDVEYYQSVFPDTYKQKWFNMKKDQAIDQYLHQNSDQKQKVIDTLKNLAKKNRK